MQPSALGSPAHCSTCSPAVTVLRFNGAAAAEPLSLPLRLRLPPQLSVSFTAAPWSRQLRRFQVAATARSHGSTVGSSAAENRGTQTTEFASLTTSSQSASSPPAVSSSDSYPGSPLLWVGVGVALCVVVTRTVEWLKKRLMKLAMEQMMNQMRGSDSPFGPNAPFPPFPQGGFPPTPPAAFTPPPPPPPPATTKREEPVTSPFAQSSTSVSTENTAPPPRQTAVFRDVEAKAADASTAPSDAGAAPSKQQEKDSKKRFFQDTEVVDDKAGSWAGWSGYAGSGSNGNGNGNGKSSESARVTIEQLEQMLDTPAIQNLVLQYVPEHMRNPETIKWYLKNPEMRRKIEEQLSSLTDGEYGPQMADMLRQFDLKSPDLAQQFETMGVTPEEAIKTIMSDPEVAMAFQNPKIQMAILECAQNPANQFKYINDKEVMDVFEKISRLFPQTM